MIKAVAVCVMLLVVGALVPGMAIAELNGSLYTVQGASVPIFFNFSVSGATFVVTILTFGPGGNGRWFAAFGPTNGVTGGGQVISPSAFNLTQPANSSFQFQLDANELAGNFQTTGLQGFLSVTSGRFVRVFP